MAGGGRRPDGAHLARLRHEPAPAQARLFRDAHQRLEALAIEAGLGPSEVVIHDLGRAELRGIWGNEEVVLVVEEIGETSPPVSAT